MSATITERFRAAVDGAGGARSVSTKAGVSPGTVHDFLAFPAAVTVSRLLQMARACDVRPEWLLTGQEPMRPGGPVTLRPTEGCSFCGAAPHAVLHMVAGERARICDGCVDLAATSCAQHRAPLARAPGAPFPTLSMEPGL